MTFDKVWIWREDRICWVLSVLVDIVVGRHGCWLPTVSLMTSNPHLQPACFRTCQPFALSCCTKEKATTIEICCLLKRTTSFLSEILYLSWIQDCLKTTLRLLKVGTSGITTLSLNIVIDVIRITASKDNSGCLLLLLTICENSSSYDQDLMMCKYLEVWTKML